MAGRSRGRLGKVGQHPFHDVAVVGIHTTRQARRLEGVTSRQIVMQAVRGALADAALALNDVDGATVTFGSWSPNSSNSHRAYPAELFAGRPCWMGSAVPGMYAFIEAAMAVATGQCQTALVASGQAGDYREHAATAPWTRPSNEFVECWGMFTAVQFALLARRHMSRFGTEPEQLAEVASTIRTNGHLNPDAVYHGRGEVSPQDVLASRMIADPFHLLDCATTSEGACAVILTSVERSVDLPTVPVYVLGAAGEYRGGYPYSRPVVWDEFGWLGEHAAKSCFEMANCSPADVDVCELYDPFSFEIIHQFEAFGFCPKGEGGPFVMDGRIRPGGQYPITTDGGTMSFGHCGAGQTMQPVIAAVRQLRGAANNRQVPNAEVALASGSGHSARGVVVLSRSRP
jgi:acetyl-CoA acetyltransferase